MRRRFPSLVGGLTPTPREKPRLTGRDWITGEKRLFFLRGSLTHQWCPSEIDLMKPYRNRSGDAGIVAYDYGRDWIQLQFAGGKIYEYTASGVGAVNVKKMMQLADSGDGLTTFVNTHPRIKDGYSR